ncbi:MAG: hypothetical protein KC481_07815 [Acidimicrobiaceae bacterium]|jgi:hypothetical protein|nr:hypothetical protein [Acidimicrobiaceae bacterium]MDB4818794.1 hypothetical protein [Acidimicrobiales bacterium]
MDPFIGQIQLTSPAIPAQPNRRAFYEVVAQVRKDSGEAHLDYLIITMEN